MGAPLQKIGFLLGLAPFLVVVFSWFTNRFLENLWILALLIGINLLVTLGLSRLFKNNALVLELKDGIESFIKWFNQIIVAIALAIVFIVGVGAIKLIGTLSGKRFLSIRKTKKSTWINVSKKKSNFEEMF